MMKLRIGMMWTMGLLTVAVAVMLTGVFNLGTAAAAMGDDSRVGAAVSQAGIGDGSVTAFTPAIAEGQGALQCVWSATLTVAEWDAGDGTAWGYLSGDEVGEVGEVAFVDRGARYVVKGIFHTHLRDDTYVLDIVTDTRLRSDLILEVDGVRYRIEDSAFVETDAFFQVWELESSLEWEEGETMTVELLR